MMRTKAPVQDRDVIIAIAQDGGASLENTTAIAPRFIRCLPVLRRCVRGRTRRAIGQGSEPEVDVAHETDITLAYRLAADLRTLLLDELRKLVAIGRAESLDAGKLDGLTLDFERAGVDDL